MKFVGFDGKGAIWHEVILNYHINEMRFCSSVQLSLSLRASDNWWCIVIVVDDGGAAGMYHWHRVSWGILIIVNYGTFSLWSAQGGSRGQEV
jgi:hypothetical protein